MKSWRDAGKNRAAGRLPKSGRPWANHDLYKVTYKPSAESELTTLNEVLKIWWIGG
jgi:hypothetical protein